MSPLLFRGAGPGAPEGFPLQVLDTTTGVVRSHRRHDGYDLVFLRSVAAGRSVLGVRGFGDRRQEVVATDVRTGADTHLGYIEGAAVCYPALSPDGAEWAALVIPDRPDLPPRHATDAALMIVPVIPSSEPESVGSVLRAAADLPVVPIDWSGDGRRVLFTRDRDGVRSLAAFDRRAEHVAEIAAGVFPRSGPDGNLLAHIDEKSVVVREGDSLEVVTARECEWPLSWLAWNPAGDRLALCEEGPAYRSRISILDPMGGAIEVLHETGMVKDLTWIAEPLNEEAFPGFTE